MRTHSVINYEKQIAVKKSIDFFMADQYTEIHKLNMRMKNPGETAGPMVGAAPKGRNSQAKEPDLDEAPESH